MHAQARVSGSNRPLSYLFILFSVFFSPSLCQQEREAKSQVQKGPYILGQAVSSNPTLPFDDDVAPFTHYSKPHLFYSTHSAKTTQVGAPFAGGTASCATTNRALFCPVTLSPRPPSTSSPSSPVVPSDLRRPTYVPLSPSSTVSTYFEPLDHPRVDEASCEVQREKLTAFVYLLIVVVVDHGRSLQKCAPATSSSRSTPTAVTKSSSSKRSSTANSRYATTAQIILRTTRKVLAAALDG